MKTLQFMPLKIRLSVVVLSLSTALTACESSSMGDRQLSGMLIGGALGGLVGNQFGHGDGRTVATGLGLALGAYVGSEIGRSMDQDDRRYHDEAARAGLWDNPSGRAASWRNPRNGAYGEFTPGAPSYVDDTGRTCRRFHDRVVFSDGTRHDVEGTACLNRAGEWVIRQR
ncbi:MAG: hypothetical protein RLZZ141_1203 [Pseudomonadota bacterium]|jgi:surface antigen